MTLIHHLQVFIFELVNNILILLEIVTPKKLIKTFEKHTKKVKENNTQKYIIQ